MPLRSMLPAALPGLILEDHYRVEERAGADALTRIYRATDLTTSTPVLVRVAHDHFAKLLSFADEFVPRLLGVRPLSHPGLLRTLSAGRAEAVGRAFLYTVTEAFEGRNLCAIVHGRGLMPAGQVVLLAVQVLESLAAAHGKGVLHLDLRPESIVLGATADGVVRPKIADFGLGSLAAECVSRLALGGSCLGTPLYASPERLRNGEVDERSDVYSMGAVLYEQLTGTGVFEASSVFELERMHVQMEPEPLQARAPELAIDPAIERVVLKALRKNPADRYQSAQEMAAALVLARGNDTAPATTARRESRTLPSTLHLNISGMSRPSAAIGRQELVESCRAAALAPFDEDNRGGVAILLGEAGVGKSAIIDEVVAGLWGGPLAIVRVEGRRSLHTPLEAFTETARDMLGLRRGEPSPRVDALGRQLQQRYGLVAEDVAHLLDRVAGRASGLALAPEVVEKEEAAALRTFFGRVLATVPGLLIIEDADALDPWSGALALDLLESTARHPVSVLVTARSEPWPEWTAPNAVRLRVGPLTEAQAGAMLRDRLVGAEPAPGILEAVNGHARGSPLVLELCARALLAGAEGDQLTAAVGESSRALVALALGGVSPAARAWLHGAALAGVRAPVAMLQAWKPAPPSSTPALLLRECAATGLARVEGDYLGFRNDGIREVIVGMVPERERRDTHRFIAEWLAAVHPARGASEVIAAQFEACGDLRRAAQHFEHAARTLLDRGVPDAAASLLKRAASVHLSARDHDSAMRVGLEHVRALLEAGDAPGAQEALARLERRGTVEAIGVRARVSALVANARGDTDAAVATLLLASGFDDPSVDLLARFEVETDAAELLRVAGRLPEAEEHAALAHRYATELLGEHQAAATAEDTARASQSASYLSRLLAHMGKFAEASQVLQGSLAEVTERGDDSAASRLLANLAFVASCEGKPADAAQHAERALVLSRGLGDRGAAARIAVNLAAYQVRLGNKADAIQTLLLARSLSRAVGWRRGVELAGDALARLKSSSG